MNKSNRRVLLKVLLALLNALFILVAGFSVLSPFIPLLLRAKLWQTIHARAATQWDASDGTTPKYVTHTPANNGLLVTLDPTETNTREAFFAQGFTTKHAFTLKADVSIPANCHGGLVFRGNAQGEYYLFLVSEKTYTVEILRRDADNDLPREAIILNTPIPATLSQPYGLMVVGDGEHYSFYINGYFVNAMNDARLTGNRVGVEVFT